MSRYLDIASWPRREHFHLFRQYERPFFSICANVDVTEIKKRASASEQSFFLTTLYHATAAANDVEPFRYRLRDVDVCIHDVVHPGSTVLMPDGTFGFAYFRFDKDSSRFHAQARSVMADIKSGRVEHLQLQDDRDDLIHYSVIPWVSFTSFSHARRFKQDDSTPKIVFGKYFADGARILMPVSVEVHHALMDGLHVGEYFEALQRSMSLSGDSP